MAFVNSGVKMFIELHFGVDGWYTEGAYLLLKIV